jgi:predicted dehydrogenase
VSWNPPWSSFRGNASASATLEMDSNVVVTYVGTFAPGDARTGWDGVWDIVGERGAVRWDGDRVLLRHSATPASARLRKRAFGREWHGSRMRPVKIGEPDRLGSLAEFASAIRERRTPATSGRDNLRSLALVSAAIESARSGVTVRVGAPHPVASTHAEH